MDHGTLDYHESGDYALEWCGYGNFFSYYPLDKIGVVLERKYVSDEIIINLQDTLMDYYMVEGLF